MLSIFASTRLTRQAKGPTRLPQGGVRPSVGAKKTPLFLTTREAGILVLVLREKGLFRRWWLRVSGGSAGFIRSLWWELRVLSG